MNNGWVKFHRSITEWEWYSDDKTFKLFFHLVLTAAHESKRFRGFDVERGSRVFGIHELAAEIGVSVQSLRTSINHLKSTNEITIKSTNKFSIVSINKYEDYQDNSTSKVTTPLTNDQQTTNHIQEWKNVRSNIKEINKEKDLQADPDFQKPEKASGFVQVAAESEDSILPSVKFGKYPTFESVAKDLDAITEVAERYGCERAFVVSKLDDMRNWFLRKGKDGSWNSPYKNYKAALMKFVKDDILKSRKEKANGKPNLVWGSSGRS